MTKTLIIAEKPSVANDIAKTLGGFTKHDEYFESDEYVLSSAVGHLVEIAVPEVGSVWRDKLFLKHFQKCNTCDFRHLNIQKKQINCFFMQ
mgnify:CR=1 FL=1